MSLPNASKPEEEIPASSATGPVTIPVSDRIPLSQKLGVSAGVCFDSLAVGVTVGGLWMPYFNIGLGISPAKLGLVLMLLRAWDAITDPIMGNISDNTRTRWGRRRPYMVVGAALVALVYPWIWRVPTGLSETGTLAYLLGIGMLFFACTTTWCMPYYSLQLEQTPSYDERTRLMAWCAFFGKLISLSGAWALAIVTGPWFVNAATGKPDIILGVRTCSWFVAGAILVVGLLPPLFGRERYYKAETSHQTKDPFFKSIAESFNCGPLWRLIGVTFFLIVGNAGVGALGQYLNIYYVNGGDIGLAAIVGGWKGTMVIAIGICCIPFWTWLGERFDKRTMVLVMLMVSILGHLTNILCMLPGLPYLQLVPAIFESSAISAVWLFLPSMKADVADHDELHTRKRREGALNAFYSWFVKAASTIGMGMSGVLLQITGFDVKLANQPEGVLLHMKWLYVLLPIFVWGVAIYFAWSYPLSRVKMAQLRKQLEDRRGKV